MAAPVRAQSTLTLEAALGEARQANAKLVQAQAAVDRASAEVDGARAAFLPRVDFSEGWQRGNGPVFVFGALLGARRFESADFAVDSLNHPEPRTSFAGRVSVSQVLFDGGLARANGSIARASHDLSLAELERARGEVDVTVVKLYGRALVAEAGQRAATAAVASAEEDVRRARERRDAGAVTEADVLALSVHLLEARQLLIAAESEIAAVHASLNRATGASVGRRLTLLEPELPRAPVEDLNALLAEAEARRPEIHVAEATEAVSKAALRAARAAWLPTLSITTCVDAAGLAFNERAMSWSAAGEFSWSLSVGGAQASRARAAAAQLASSRAARRDASAAVQVEVITAIRGLQTALARAALTREAVAAAREAHRITRDRYEAGLAGVSDLLRAAGAELAAEQARAQAVVDAVVADAELRRALGHPVTGKAIS